MSNLEKTINLLETLPDYKIDAVYAFVRFIHSQEYESISAPVSPEKNDVRAMLGIAHEYANPSLIEQEEGAFEHAMVEKYAADRY